MVGSERPTYHVRMVRLLTLSFGLAELLTKNRTEQVALKVLQHLKPAYYFVISFLPQLRCSTSLE